MRWSQTALVALGSLVLATGSARAAAIVGSDLTGNFGPGWMGDSAGDITVIATGYSAPSAGVFNKVNVLHDGGNDQNPDDAGGEKLVLYVLRPTATNQYTVLAKNEFTEPAGYVNSTWSASFPDVAVQAGDTFGFINGHTDSAPGCVMFGDGTKFDFSWPLRIDQNAGDSFSFTPYGITREYGINVEFTAVPEPTSLGLAGIACMGLLSRRRRA